ncbi:MAG: bacillithiol biosynthesis BshC, partial [Deinococcales bacterium]
MSRDDTPPFRTTFLDRYRSGDLSEFFDLPAGDVEAALRIPRPGDRLALAAAMREHARRLGAPEAVHRSLDRLEHPESRVVVAGQQTGLLLGPAYSLTKAITAVRLAQRLDREERPV